MGGALGLGELGLGLMSYFDQKKNSKAQRKLANQQYANNAQMMADHQSDRKNVGDLFRKRG